MLLEKRYEIIWADKLAELEPHEKKWDYLTGNCPGSGPTQTYGWIKNFFQFKAEGRKWVCLFAYAGDELVGVYPLIGDKRKGFAGVYFQSFYNPFHNIHTYRTDGLILPGNEDVLPLFLKEITRKLKVFPIVRVNGVPGYSSTLRSFNDRSSGLSGFVMPAGREDYLDVSGSWQDYLAGLNSKFLREIRRQNRRMNEKYQTEQTIRDNDRSNQDCLSGFLEVEDSGWKGLKGTSIRKNDGDTQLFTHATESFARNKMMLWSFLRTDQNTVAAQLAVKVNEIVYLWKIGYKEDYAAYAPGNLLIFSFVENCFADHTIREINFMNERSWLKTWNVSKRQLYNVTVFPSTFLLSTLLSIFFKIKFGKRIKKLITS